MSKSIREPKITLMPKGKKMDPYTVSSQPWEIQYVAGKFNVKPDKVRAARKAVGKSRRKIYNWLRALSVLLLFVSCNRALKKPSRDICFVIVHTREAVNKWSFGVRTNYISGSTNGRAKWETSWQYPTQYRYDNNGVKKDSTGKPKIYGKDSLVSIGKDSVMWRGIDGVPIDSLLRSFKPRGLSK